MERIVYMVKVSYSVISSAHPVAVYECYDEATARAGREYERGAWYTEIVEIPYFPESQIHDA